MISGRRHHAHPGGGVTGAPGHNCAREILREGHVDAEVGQVVDGEGPVAQREFAGNVAHELRNPLSPIVTALELMKLRGESGSAKERGIIVAEVKRLKLKVQGSIQGETVRVSGKSRDDLQATIAAL